MTERGRDPAWRWSGAMVPPSTSTRMPGRSSAHPRRPYRFEIRR